MNKLTVADVDTDMGPAGLVGVLEEYHVTGLQTGLGNGRALSVHGGQGTADIEAQRPQHIIDKAGAVKAAGIGAAPLVGDTQLLLCRSNDPVTGCSAAGGSGAAGGNAAGGRTTGGNTAGGRTAAVQRTGAGSDTGRVATAEELGGLGGGLVLVGSFGQVHIVTADIADGVFKNALHLEGTHGQCSGFIKNQGFYLGKGL